jgi:hypothetical protein
MDTVGFGLSGYVPALEGLPHYDTDGFGGSHLYMPWWLWEKHNQIGFPRGYHIEIGGGYGMPWHRLVPSAGPKVRIRQESQRRRSQGIRHACGICRSWRDDSKQSQLL